MKQERITQNRGHVGDTHHSGTVQLQTRVFGLIKDLLEPLHKLRTICISSEVGLSEQVGIQTIHEAVPNPGFAKIDHLNDVQENRVVIDLDTTGLSNNT